MIRGGLYVGSTCVRARVSVGESLAPETISEDLAGVGRTEDGLRTRRSGYCMALTEAGGIEFPANVRCDVTMFCRSVALTI